MQEAFVNKIEEIAGGIKIESIKMDLRDEKVLKLVVFGGRDVHMELLQRFADKGLLGHVQ